MLGISQSLPPVYQSSLVLISAQKYPPTVNGTCISFHLKSAPTSPLVSRNYRPDRSETAAWLLLPALRALGLIAPCRWTLEGKGWPAQERTGDWGKYAGTSGTFEDFSLCMHLHDHCCPHRFSPCSLPHCPRFLSFFRLLLLLLLLKIPF